MNLSLDKNSSAFTQLALLAGLVAIIGATVIMLWLSWGKWPDVLIDFGRELYVPWMLAEGKILYRDLLYFRGPLSPYWNALCFLLFGPSLFTLVSINLTLLAIMLVVTYKVLRGVSSSFASFTACLVFLFLFGFNQYVGIGNYNYICPYAHEATHGMLFSWVALLCLIEYASSHRITWLALSGFVSGLIFLIKPEFFIAVMAASVTGLGLWVWLARPNLDSAAKSLGVFIAAQLISPLAAFALLSIKLSWFEAAVGTLGEWGYIWNSRVSELSFFRAGIGIANTLDNVKALLITTGVYFSIMFSAGAVAIVFRSRQTVIFIAVLEAVVVFALARLFWNNLPWFEIGRPLPLLLIILGVWNLTLFIRQREKKYLSAVIVIIFSLVLLLKMLLNTKLYHYGFVLAMPATLVLVVAMLDWFPSEIKRKGGQQVLFFTMILSILSVITLRYVDFSLKNYALKQVTVGKGADTFLADLRGQYVNFAVNWLKINAKSHETLAVLPEGVMINYLARIRNSTPVITAIPSDIFMFSEERILQLIKESPPTYVVFVHRDDTEYGYRFFGADYGQSIMNWIRGEYKPVQLIGAMPFQDNRFGILILKRKGIKD